MAHICATETLPERDAVFILKALNNAPTALIKQPHLPNHVDQDSFHHAQLLQFDLEDCMAKTAPFQIGWGTAAWQNGRMSIEKKASAAGTDPQFYFKTLQYSQQTLSNFLVHLRQVMTPQKAESKDNIHPFHLNDWVLAHKGAIPVDVKETILVRLKEAQEADPTVQLPKGDTDSEVVACYLSLKLRERTGQKTTMDISPTELEKVFREVVSEIILEPKPLSDAQVAQSAEEGFISGQRNTNHLFAVMNGKQLLVSKVLPHYNAYFVGTRHHKDGEKSYLISHYPIDFNAAPQDDDPTTIEWSELPNDAITSFTRTSTPNGKPIIEVKRLDLPVRANRTEEIEEDTLQIHRVYARLQEEASNRRG